MEDISINDGFVDLADSDTVQTIVTEWIDDAVKKDFIPQKGVVPTASSDLYYQLFLEYYNILIKDLDDWSHAHAVTANIYHPFDSENASETLPTSSGSGGDSFAISDFSIAYYLVEDLKKDNYEEWSPPATLLKHIDNAMNSDLDIQEDKVIGGTNALWNKIIDKWYERENIISLMETELSLKEDNSELTDEEIVEILDHQNYFFISIGIPEEKIIEITGHTPVVSAESIQESLDEDEIEDTEITIEEFNQAFVDAGYLELVEAEPEPETEEEESENLEVIHVGKCGGSHIKHNLTLNNIEHTSVYNKTAEYDANKKYLIVIRNPIKRFISAFNLRYYQVVHSKSQEDRFHNEKNLLTEYDNVDKLCEGLQSNPNLINGENDSGNYIYLLKEDINYHLKNLINVCPKEQIHGVIFHDTAKEDLKDILGIDLTEESESENLDYNYDKDIKNESYEILKEYLKEDFDIIDEMFNKGWISEEQHTLSNSTTDVIETEDESDNKKKKKSQ
jgi:hypothetical protein